MPIARADPSVACRHADRVEMTDVGAFREVDLSCVENGDADPHTRTQAIAEDETIDGVFSQLGSSATATRATSRPRRLRLTTAAPSCTARCSGSIRPTTARGVQVEEITGGAYQIWECPVIAGYPSNLLGQEGPSRSPQEVQSGGSSARRFAAIHTARVRPETPAKRPIDALVPRSEHHPHARSGSLPPSPPSAPLFDRDHLFNQPFGPPATADTRFRAGRRSLVGFSLVEARELEPFRQDFLDHCANAKGVGCGLVRFQTGWHVCFRTASLRRSSSTPPSTRRSTCVRT